MTRKYPKVGERVAFVLHAYRVPLSVLHRVDDVIRCEAVRGGRVAQRAHVAQARGGCGDTVACPGHVRWCGTCAKGSWAKNNQIILPCGENIQYQDATREAACSLHGLDRNRASL